MHFEILVEDLSGKTLLDVIVPKIIGNAHTFKVHPYRGIGRIPKNMRDTANAERRILLENLPKLLKGYRKAFNKYAHPDEYVVVLVCDLDDKCLREFRAELYGILKACHPRPRTRFCIAIEEGEAWLLGDLQAVKRAYPKAKDTILETYVNDSICGTWECLANAVYAGGAKSLVAKGWQVVGAEKSAWADKISPHLDLSQNASDSFNHFQEKLRELVNPSAE